MKIKLSELKKLIKEEISLAKADDSTRFLHGADEGQAFDDEAEMVKIQLLQMSKMAEEVCELLRSGDQLPAWTQSHIAVAHENLRQVHGYLTGDAALDAGVQLEAKNHVKRLNESHARITQEEIQAWKNGDWQFMSEMHNPVPDQESIVEAFYELKNSDPNKIVTLSNLAMHLGVNPNDLRVPGAMDGTTLRILDTTVVLENL